jgi:hypothetical protein
LSLLRQVESGTCSTDYILICFYYHLVAYILHRYRQQIHRPTNIAVVVMVLVLLIVVIVLHCDLLCRRHRSGTRRGHSECDPPQGSRSTVPRRAQDMCCVRRDEIHKSAPSLETQNPHGTRNGQIARGCLRQASPS